MDCITFNKSSFRNKSKLNINRQINVSTYGESSNHAPLDKEYFMRYVASLLRKIIFYHKSVDDTILRNSILHLTPKTSREK